MAYLVDDDPTSSLLMSPGMAMAGQAMQNLTNMRMGGGINSPIDAYQRAVFQRAQLEQQRKQMEAQQRMRENNRFGTYNPRDYTASSFAEFRKTGDPDVLVKDYGAFTQGGMRLSPNEDGTYSLAVNPEVVTEAAADQAAAIGGAKVSAEEFARNQEAWRASEAKLLGSIDSAKSKAEVVSSTVQDILPLLDEWTTGYGASLAGLPATEAKRLDNLLDTIRANVAFMTLQDMRANSPTGGALGNTSEGEMRLLMAALGSLDQAGNMDDLAKVLRRIDRINMGAVDRLESAYDMDQKRYNPNAEEPAPAQQPDAMEGRTATNPQTGETLIYRNGQWQPQ